MKKVLTIAALVAALAAPAATEPIEPVADSLPSAMLGTWCTQPVDAQGTPMKRCAPGAPDAISMTPHAMDSEGDRCRVVSVKTLEAARWLVSHVCHSQPGMRYGRTYFRDGESLYLAPVGTFTFTGEEPRRAGHDDTPGCFTRTYDKTHLGKHPDQLVTSMRLRLTDDDSEFALRVTLRGRDDAFYIQGWCSQKSYGLLCHVDGADNGSVRVLSRRRGVAMLHLDDRIRVSVTDSGESQWLSAGKDDDVFRLDRVAERVCRGM